MKPVSGCHHVSIGHHSGVGATLRLSRQQIESELRTEIHMGASAAAGVGVWGVTGDPIAVPVAIAAGVLPDVDHVVDFYNWYWRRSRRRVLLLLHAWEWVIALYAIAVFAIPEPWMIALASGYFTQVALDQFGYRVRWHTYSILARATQRFESGKVLPDGAPLGSFRSLTRMMPLGRQRAEDWFLRRFQ